MNTPRWVVLWAGLGMLLSFGGCLQAFEPPEFPDISQQEVFEPTGKGIGFECGASSECRPGLECGDEGTCEVAGTQVIGQQCIVSAECEDGAMCAPNYLCVGATHTGDTQCETNADCQTEEDANARCVPLLPNVCQAEGEGVAGEPCSQDRDCEKGLFCEYVGVTGICLNSGTLDWGGTCEESTECMSGLVCSTANKCVGLVEALVDAQWDGATCEEPVEDNPRVYFEVPDADGLLAEFYRLPFPNDIRLGEGKLTAGHPAPGASFISFDPVQRILDAASEGIEGFGAAPTVLFRFSTKLDFGTVDFSEDDTPANLRLVNIDPGSDSYRQPRGYIWAASDGRGKYVCNNWLLIRNQAADPLENNTTYAALILKGMRSCLSQEGGGCNGDSPDFAADEDLLTLLADSAPSDGRMKAAWDKYAKLRTYLSDEGIDPGDVRGAAVFTTGDPTAVMAKARGVVRSEDPPALSEVTVCGDGVQSPCADGEAGRECGPTNENFTEVHGKIAIPIFQEGDAPYLSPEDGGALKVENGVPVKVRTEEVCFALSVPKGDAPADGWPVIVYSHGTGGTFRSFVQNGTAENMAKANANDSGGGIAVLSIDGSMHGPRRNGSALSPEVLFFNIGNPKAARGNVFQGAIDNLALVYWASSGVDEVGGVPNGKLDAARIGFLGHSQGATIGPVFAAFEPDLGAVLLSGAGAGLVESLLNKTDPVNIPAAVQLVLREDGAPDATHPVLSLMQQFFDPVDNVNYGALLTRTPPEGVDPHHLMVVYGQNDTFTPDETTRLLADVARLNLAEPPLDVGPGEAFEGYLGDNPDNDRVISTPIVNNATVGEKTVTQGLVQYAPTGDYNGHFVITRHPTAVKQSREFFATFFRTGTAEIVSP